MSQYQTGTVSVTNGSSTVTGAGTAWASNANTGDLFAVEGDGVLYVIASVGGNGQITLAANYAGSTAGAASYAISRDFTPNEGLPLMAPGDLEATAVYSRAMTLLDQKLKALGDRLTAGGL